MKKILALGLVSLSLSATLAQARTFVGIDAGYDRGSFESTNGLAKKSYTGFINAPAEGWNVGINVGGEWFFGEYVGLRTFLGLGYGQAFAQANTNLHVLDVNLNFDIMANVVNTGSFSTGLFVGVGAGFGIAAQKLSAEALVSMNIPIYGRAGITFGLGEHSRIDVTAILPILSYNMIGFMGTDAETAADMVAAGVPGAYNPLRFNVGYKFLF
ncbi:hypothetical protein CQA53_06300 [Helicobacter didelphidarum]|uniref:Outer membrane beta-barrel protein n=1 Tax=Helicobacter didelphidarum TaxID=2040648 RepID=A0A3D8ILD7_9HELI|nr:outer membrane beta-barrel protein [Helicobacter didelphidarum]RDU65381.1 hypothetical protein CQA53_06300 [Helicobacter didelphidarum]